MWKYTPNCGKFYKINGQYISKMPQKRKDDTWRKKMSISATCALLTITHNWKNWQNLNKVHALIS